MFYDYVISTLFITANGIGPEINHLLFLESDLQVWAHKQESLGCGIISELVKSVES